MRKEKGYALCFVLIFIVLITVSMVSSIVAEPASPYTFGESFNSLFSTWNKGDVAPNVAKIIFAVLLVFIIYVLLDATGFVENKPVKWVISILVSFLSTMYIAPNEVYALLVSYTALGLTLGSILPLIIMLGFTFSAIKSGDPTHIFLQWIAWAAFAAFMVYRAVMVFVYETATVSPTVTAILLGMTGAALAMLLFNKTLTGIFAKKLDEATAQTTERRLKGAAKTVKALDRFGKEVSSKK